MASPTVRTRPGARIAWVVLSALAACLVGCGTRPAPTERKGRIISITDATRATGGSDTVRLGHLHPGETAAVKLWIANKTTTPVAILAYERSCGCTALTHDTEPIAPEKAQQVELRFDARGLQGWQFKVVDIQLSGSAHPLRLFVEADVK